MQRIRHPELLARIEAFLSETGMGSSYLGKAAAKNSELVARLRAGGRVWPETEAALDSFMTDYRARRAAAPGDDQDTQAGAA